MLSSVLNSKQAIQVNIQIVRIFSRIRQFIIDSGELKLEIEEIKQVSNQDKNIELVFTYLDKLIDKKLAQEKGLAICLMICDFNEYLKILEVAIATSRFDSGN